LCTHVMPVGGVQNTEIYQLVFIILTGVKNLKKEEWWSGKKVRQKKL